MQYVLGIDSGGTKYLVRAAATDGTVLGEYRGTTCSHYQLEVEEAQRRIDAHLTACLETFGGRREDCVRLVCGTTGYDSPEDGEILQALYHRLPGFSCPICCMNDVELAHYITTGGYGILVLGGTGSIAFGRNAQGEERRVGGWTKSIMGEEGSGRYVDAWALHHYSRYLDGCRPHSPLIDHIQQTIGSSTRKGLMDYSMAMMKPPWASPNLGPAVNQAAENGDPYAQEILRSAGEWMFKLAEETLLALGMEKDASIPVGIWGGLLLASPRMQAELRRLLSLRYPQAKLVRPVCDAAQGAVELALRWLKAGGDDCKGLLQEGRADQQREPAFHNPQA